MQKATKERTKAKVFQHGDGQAVRLPADFRFDADEVYATRDDSTGDVVLSTEPNGNVWKAFTAFRDSLEIPQHDLDDYLAERPMNVLSHRPGVFENDD